ncbi:UDP-4-amino-4,6-dideoxy-N-acetyl-beta-L-altrosamine transaminase [Pseudoalteromonas phenolica]|uniref:Spore coat protein n=1 Tax=Pseudoalteromonas phenolica TaxID=161398 RepID=A0A0S2JZ40_9GAMM|nr:UDP-4-amino-4,6-dideoxy-N-acetyl-beta-L-altrosamine transaminase [Pseudoalteromonas phenolica]ALO41447.1 spore coat protein [Pseudoalteromonas phenolica]MBE0354007.1 hypothetical protein [Pseudoalteromonas phenolica O-BC30]
MIPYGKQHIDQDDINAVVEVLNSDYLTQGPRVPQFEGKVAEYCNAKYAVAVNSATSALHIACLALGVGEGDIVWTSPNSFVASSNCALYCGAQVDFVDINPRNGNLCTSALEQKLKTANINNCLPKVIIPVHFSGQPCDMEAISKLANKYDIKIIEDASHAIGAEYQNNKVGSCQYSDICIFSFHPVKIITSAEGGIALTNNNALANVMKKLRSHGVTSDVKEFTESSHGPWYYQQQMLGFNYRMSDLHAAIGITQLSKLDDFVLKRNLQAKKYIDKLIDLPVTPLEVSDAVLSSYHLFIILIDKSCCVPKKHIVELLRKEGIFAHVHYIPIYKQPFYKKLGFSETYCDYAEQYYEQAITLPLYPQMTEEQQNKVIGSLKKVLNTTDSI